MKDRILSIRSCLRQAIVRFFALRGLAPRPHPATLSEAHLRRPVRAHHPAAGVLLRAAHPHKARARAVAVDDAVERHRKGRGGQGRPGEHLELHLQHPRPRLAAADEHLRERPVRPGGDALRAVRGGAVRPPRPGPRVRVLVVVAAVAANIEGARRPRYAC